MVLAEQRAELLGTSSRKEAPTASRKSVFRDFLPTYCTGGREGEGDLAKNQKKGMVLPVHWNEEQTPEHPWPYTHRARSEASKVRAGILLGCSY